MAVGLANGFLFVDLDVGLDSLGEGWNYRSYSMAVYNVEGGLEFVCGVLCLIDGVASVWITSNFLRVYEDICEEIVLLCPLSLLLLEGFKILRRRVVL